MQQLKKDIMDNQQKLMSTLRPEADPLAPMADLLEKICRMCFKHRKFKGLNLFRNKKGVDYAELILQMLDVEVILRTLTFPFT